MMTHRYVQLGIVLLQYTLTVDAFRIPNQNMIPPTNSHYPIKFDGTLIVLHAEQSPPQQQTRKKKKNKYEQFSKQTSLDPMDAMLLESRTKLKEISKQSKREAASLDESIEAVDQLLSSIGAPFEESEEKKLWERNKRQFPDNKSIDPYDPTTYGYIELGT
jgi:hypothetical protein